MIPTPAEGASEFSLVSGAAFSVSEAEPDSVSCEAEVWASCLWDEQLLQIRLQPGLACFHLVCYVVIFHIIQPDFAVFCVHVNTISGGILNQRMISIGKNFIDIQVITVILFSHMDQNVIQCIYIGVVDIVTGGDFGVLPHREHR